MYDDPEENTGTQERRVRMFRAEESRQKEEQGRVAEITADLVLRARGNMQSDEATGAEDIIATEILKELRIETVCVIVKLFQRRFCGECDSPVS